MQTKVHIVKAMVFLLVMYRCESWMIKKAEHQKTDAFELWYCRRLESLLDSKEIKPVNPKGDQSWIFIGRTHAVASILWPPDGKSQFIGKDPNAGKDWGQEEKGARGWDGWMASPTQWTWIWANWELVKDREAWYAVVHGVAKSWTQLSNCNKIFSFLFLYSVIHWLFRSFIRLFYASLCARKI